MIDDEARLIGRNQRRRPPTDACNVASEIRDVASVDGA